MYIPINIYIYIEVHIHFGEVKQLFKMSYCRKKDSTLVSRENNYFT